MPGAAAAPGAVRGSAGRAAAARSGAEPGAGARSPAGTAPPPPGPLPRRLSTGRGRPGEPRGCRAASPPLHRRRSPRAASPRAPRCRAHRVPLPCPLPSPAGSTAPGDPSAAPQPSPRSLFFILGACPGDARHADAVTLLLPSLLSERSGFPALPSIGNSMVTSLCSAKENQTNKSS